MFRQPVIALLLISLVHTAPISTPPTLGQTPPPATVDSSYLLGVGDTIQIDVFNAPDYSGEYQILTGGVVNLAFVGNVPVAGLTLRQASDLIRSELAYYIRRPRITLNLLEARPLQIAISGEVDRPGSYRFAQASDSAGQVNEIPTLTQAIERAGGITQFADLRNIEIQRQVSRLSDAASIQSPLTTGAQVETLQINLWQLLKDSRLEEDVLLQDGDRITIPTAVALTPEEITELASASFSPDEMVVNVVGEVESPGAIPLPPNTPLNQAILAAGGFNNRARTRRVTLVRLNPNGSVTQQTISVDLTAGINDESNPALQPNDTVVIGRSTLSRVGDTVGNVVAPLGGIFGIFNVIDRILD